jgi:hypothetical protein
METIVGLLPDEDHLATALAELSAAGIAADRMQVGRQPAEVWRLMGGRSRAAAAFRQALKGALIGLALGATYGLVAGILNCRLMGCPLERSVIFFGLISLFSTLAGGLMGGFVGLDQLERPLYSLVHGAMRGQPLIMVQIQGEQACQVCQILADEQCLLVHNMAA